MREKLINQFEIPSETVTLPPNANRGVENTEVFEQIAFDDLLKNQYNGMVGSIDYLEFTVFDFSLPDDVIKYILELEPADFIDLERGGGGYPKMWRYNGGDIRILHGADIEKMGIHVTITGDGCICLFAKVLPSVLFYNFLEYKVNVTRMDLALDNFDDIYYYPSDLDLYVNNSLISSRWRTCRFMHEKTMQGVVTGSTFYLGSTTSDLFCRVYDKRLEQSSKGIEIDREWVRWELVFKRDRAQAVFVELMNNDFQLGETFAGVLTNYFNILEPSNDSNRSRWAFDRKWKRFIGEVKPIRLYRIIKERNIDTIKMWVVKQVMPSLSTIMQAEDSLDWIVSEIFANQNRLSPRHIRLIDEYKAG